MLGRLSLEGGWLSRLALGRGLLPIDRARVPAELLAGVSLAALAIPEAMGYTTIAGMPVITGLYTMLLPVVVFAFLGASRHLVVGADSATAAIMAASLGGLAAQASPDYVALASLAALMTAGWLILARIIGLGFLADFLSRSVLVGFLTGVGIQVAVAQLAAMLGVPGGGSGTIDKALSIISQRDHLNFATLVISASVLAMILGIRVLGRHLPGPLIAVAVSIAAGYALPLEAAGVALLGPVPSGLPSLQVPHVAWWSIPPLAGPTAAMFVVILAQSAATGRAFAARYQERPDEDSDLVGLSIANVAAGLSGTFVVNGSPTKTQIVDGAGGRTQLAQLACAVVVLLVLVFLTGPLAYLPIAALAAIVFLIGLELVDVAGLRRVRYARPREFWVALATALTVVLLGVEEAIVVAMALSLISHTRRGYSPHNAVLVPTRDGFWRSEPVETRGEAAPGVIVYRFTHSLYYANSDKFLTEALALTRAAHSTPPVKLLCVDGAAIDDVDFTAGAMLVQVAMTLRDRHVRLVFAGLSDHVRGQLDRWGVTAIVGQNGFVADLGELGEEFERGRN